MFSFENSNSSLHDQAKTNGGGDVSIAGIVREAYADGGAFCIEHGLSQVQLVYWRRKYRMESAGGDGAAFVEIRTPASSGQTQVEVTYPSGIRMRFFGPVSASYLATLAAS